MGPSVISDVRVRLGNGDAAQHDNWATVAAELREQQVVVTGWTDLSPGRPLGVDRSVMLFSFEVGVEDGRVVGLRVQDILDDLLIEVAYGSIYGDSLTVNWPPED